MGYNLDATAGNRPSRQQFVNLNRRKISSSRNSDALLNVSFKSCARLGTLAH